MYKIKKLGNIIGAIIFLYSTLTLAQPTDLVLENMIISDTQLFQATNSIIVGPNFVITNTGSATLKAPSVTLRNLLFVVQGGEMFILSETTSVDVESEDTPIPIEYSLSQNYPNPFNPSTTIEFSLPENVKNVTISVYNILGQKVAELVNGEMVAGRYHYQWNARNLASGMYIYELRTEKFTSVKKMLLLK